MSGLTMTLMNPSKGTKKRAKFSAKQLAAQRRFAERARAGTLRKGSKLKKSSTSRAGASTSTSRKGATTMAKKKRKSGGRSSGKRYSALPSSLGKRSSFKLNRAGLTRGLTEAGKFGLGVAAGGLGASIAPWAVAKVTNNDAWKTSNMRRFGVKAGATVAMFVLPMMFKMPKTAMALAAGGAANMSLDALKTWGPTSVQSYLSGEDDGSIGEDLMESLMGGDQPDALGEGSYVNGMGENVASEFA